MSMDDQAAASPPANSPSASYSSPTLSQLVTHFVSAKRALASTSLVYRANEIVHIARNHLEESAVLRAKNAFLRNGVTEQIHVLDALHDGLDAVGRDTDAEFKAVIRALDVANDRLHVTLASLRKTIVSNRLRSAQGVPLLEDSNEDAVRATASEEPQKTLHDFIHEATHLSLLDSLRATIDSYNDAQASLQDTRAGFGDSLQALNAAVQEADEVMAETKPSHDTLAHAEDSTRSDSIPSLFHSLTTQATETASLLQSLISHYDLCITALKHTEGGGEAARAATSPTPDDTPVEESLYRATHWEPISHDERQEMLSVLENDAAEVDEVVHDIGDLVSSMETALHSLASHARTARRTHATLRRILAQLRTLGTALPVFVAAARTFRESWTQLRAEIAGKTQELVDLAVFYDSFLASYGALLREVSRRQMVEAKVRKIADRARRDMDALYHEDVDMREQFVREVGEFLPRDIWPGLVEAPARWEVGRAGGATVEEPEG